MANYTANEILVNLNEQGILTREMMIDERRDDRC